MPTESIAARFSGGMPFPSILHFYANVAVGASNENFRHRATGVSVNVGEAFLHHPKNSGLQLLRETAKISRGA